MFMGKTQASLALNIFATKNTKGSKSITTATTKKSSK